MSGCRLVLAFALGAPVAVFARESDEELAKKLSNPIASLISVPAQLNYDESIGPLRDGSRTILNIQPVIPIEINKDWNLISRTIAPIVWQRDIFPGAGRQNGLGDVVQSLFFSPKAPTADGWIWGAGPVFLLPTGSDDLLSAKKWGTGPTAVVLKAAVRLDLRRALQPHLVDCRRQRPFPREQHLPAAIPYVHDQRGVDLWPQHRVDLRLESEAMVGPAQRQRCQAGALRQTAGEPWRRRALLGRQPRGRPARLGRAGVRDAPLSDLRAAARLD